MKNKILCAGLLALTTFTVTGCDSKETESNLLKDRYSEYFSIGAAMGHDNQVIYEDGLAHHFNSFTCENEMKWAQLQPSEGYFYYQRADAQVEYAKKHDMAIRGHAFVWHESAPNWIFNGENNGVASKELVLERIRTHIDNVAKYYKDTCYAWDVVNEVISDTGEETYRDSKFYQICGEDFIIEAFKQARKSLDEVGATDVKLYYNDYSMNSPEKRAKTIEMLEMLIENDVPIDGIGMQAHYNMWSFDIDEFAKSIDMFSDLGLDVQITEIDMSVYKQDYTGPAYDEFYPELADLQAAVYRQIFEVLRARKDKVSNVTFWGVADDYTWLHTWPTGTNRTNHPLLFDADHNPKAAFHAIMNFKED